MLFKHPQRRAMRAIPDARRGRAALTVPNDNRTSRLLLDLKLRPEGVVDGDPN
jgi:hypothetical protein